VADDRRLRVVIFQEGPGVWVVRGLEHELLAEARTIGGAVRATIKLVEAHASFDSRHNLRPLAAFRPSPQTYWNAYHSGTPVSLTQLGVTSPPGWNISVAFAHRRPDRQPTPRVA
jgi:hypothetical protein